MIQCPSHGVSLSKSLHIKTLHFRKLYRSSHEVSRLKCLQLKALHFQKFDFPKSLYNFKLNIVEIPTLSCVQSMMFNQQNLFKKALHFQELYISENWTIIVRFLTKLLESATFSKTLHLIMFKA